MSTTSASVLFVPGAFAGSQRPHRRPARPGCRVRWRDRLRATGRHQPAPRSRSRSRSAAQQAVTANYSGTATLEAVGDAQVVAKTSGIVLKLPVEEGMHVSKGERARAARRRGGAQQAGAGGRRPCKKAQAAFDKAEKGFALHITPRTQYDSDKYDLETQQCRGRRRAARSVLHAHRRADRRRDRQALDQARQPGADQPDAVPDRRHGSAAGRAQRARARPRHAQGRPDRAPARRRAARQDVRRQHRAHRAGRRRGQRHVPRDLRIPRPERVR